MVTQEFVSLRDVQKYKMAQGPFWVFAEAKMAPLSFLPLPPLPGTFEDTG